MVYLIYNLDQPYKRETLGDFSLRVQDEIIKYNAAVCLGTNLPN
jgi:hypothetical protein